MLATIDRFRQSNGEVPFQERQRVHGQTTSLMLQPSRICERLFDISSPEVPFCGPAQTRGRSDSRPGQPRPDWCPDRSRSNVAPSLSSGSGHAPHHGRPARKTSRRLNRNRRRPILHRTRSKRVQPHRRLGESRPGAFTHARDESLDKPCASRSFVTRAEARYPIGSWGTRCSSSGHHYRDCWTARPPIARRSPVNPVRATWVPRPSLRRCARARAGACPLGPPDEKTRTAAR